MKALFKIFFLKINEDAVKASMQNEIAAAIGGEAFVTTVFIVLVFYLLCTINEKSNLFSTRSSHVRWRCRRCVICNGEGESYDN